MTGRFDPRPPPPPGLASAGLLDVGEVLQTILPSGTAASACTQDLVEAEVYPCERRLIAAAVPARRKEFATARACARTALGKIGFPPVAIPAAASGAPVWPAGVVGSITHCEGFRAAAVGRRRELASLGIDAEPNRSLLKGVLGDVAARDERRALRQLRVDHPLISWDRLMFCAKEALYKCLAPLSTRCWGFLDARVDFAPKTGTFLATLTCEGNQNASLLEGHWSVFRGVLLATVAVSGDPVTGSHLPVHPQ